MRRTTRVLLAMAMATVLGALVSAPVAAGGAVLNGPIGCCDPNGGRV